MKGYHISSPYHSREHQIVGIPIYYFQGTIDPATPEEEAKKHFGSQLSIEKIYVSIRGYSHMNMFGMTKCQSGLWDSIDDSPRKLVKILNACVDPNIKIFN